MDAPSTAKMLPWIAACAAIAGAVSAVVALRALHRGFGLVLVGRAIARQAPSLPWPLRALLSLAVPLGDLIGPRIPLHIRERLQRRLRQAGLDEELAPQHWLACMPVAASLAAAVASSLGGGVATASTVGLVAGSLPALWLRDRIARRRLEVMRDLPVYLDMVILGLEAGGALGVALKVATDRAPDSALRSAFLRAQGDLRAGRSRAESLTALADRLDIPAIRPMVAALVQAGSTGASLAAVLRAQADQRLEERFARAEKLALEAPVKMLAPLVLCIFPCTFVVLAFPVVMRFIGEG